MKMIAMQIAGLTGLALILLPGLAAAHCDTMGGPVIATARKALEKGDVTPVLKWVRKDDEGPIRKLFQMTLAVREKGDEARELADMYFFETLVRIHRAGEGAPYTGLKSAGDIEPSVEAADRALERGLADRLVDLVTHDVEEGIRKRFEHVKEAKKHADESIEAGRRFVEAYVEFTHYVERVHMSATAHGSHHGMEGSVVHDH